jgi:hypothetical protein
MRNSLVWMIIMLILFIPIQHMSYANSNHQIIEVKRIVFTEPNNLVEPYVLHYHDVRLAPISIKDDNGTEYWMILRKKPIIIDKKTLHNIPTDFDLPAYYKRATPEDLIKRCHYYVEDHYIYWYFEKETQGILKKYSIQKNSQKNQIDFIEKSSIILAEFSNDYYERLMNKQIILPYVSKDRAVFTQPSIASGIQQDDSITVNMVDVISGKKMWIYTIKNAYLGIIKQIIDHKIALLYIFTREKSEDDPMKCHFQQYLYGINLDDGEIVWKLDFNDRYHIFLSPPATVNYTIDSTERAIFVDKDSSDRGFVISGYEQYLKSQPKDEYECSSFLISSKGEPITKFFLKMPFPLLNDVSAYMDKPIVGNNHFISVLAQDGHFKRMIFFNYALKTTHSFSIPNESINKNAVQYLTSPLMMEDLIIVGDYYGKGFHFFELIPRDTENGTDQVLALKTYHKNPAPDKNISNLFKIDQNHFGLVTIDAMHIYEVMP